MKLSELHSALFYRSDEVIQDNNRDLYYQKLKSGNYNGRYFASSYAAACHYSDSPYIIEAKIPLDALVVDGLGGYVGFFIENELSNPARNYRPSVSELNQYRREAHQQLVDANVPIALINQFDIMAQSENHNNDISHYNGHMSKEQLELYKQLSQYFLHEHLYGKPHQKSTGHGQVALLGRNLKADEFMRLIDRRLTS